MPPQKQMRCSALIAPSPLGWFAIGGTCAGIRFLLIGHETASQVQEALQLKMDRMIDRNKVPQLLRESARLVEKYLSGEVVDLSGIPIDWMPKTAFQRDITTTLRTVGYGKTVTYGELASLAGRQGAARAVGRVMATNPIPLLIPCHRVIGADRRLTGFSAPRGIDLKADLLRMESGNLERNRQGRHSQDAGNEAFQIRRLTAKQ